MREEKLGEEQWRLNEADSKDREKQVRSMISTGSLLAEYERKWAWLQGPAIKVAYLGAHV